MGEKLTDDLELYSDLLLSVGTHKSARPLIPIEVSKLISRLKEEENLPDQDISKRLDLGKPKKITTLDTPRDTTQIAKFLSLQKVSPKSQKLFGWGSSEPDKIPFTTGTVIAGLSEYSDQDVVIQSSLERGITKNEALHIVRLKKNNPEIPISECIEKVLKIRPITEVWYIVSHTPNPEILEKIKEKSKRDNKSENECVKEILKSYFKTGSIQSVILRGSTFFISMDKVVDDLIEQQQKHLKKHFTNLMDMILVEGLK